MKFDLSGLSVMIAMPTRHDIPPQTVISLIETADQLRVRGIPFEIHLKVGGSVVEVSRSKCVHAFLASTNNRLFWVDSDIVWSADAFIRLLALSVDMPVVAAAYPARQDPLLFMLNLGARVMEANQYGCFPVKGLGLGFTVVRRDVIEALSGKAPKLKFPDMAEPIPHLFRQDSINGEFRGEDIAFFSDIRDLGHTVHIDPSVTLGHVGSKAFTASLGDYLLKENDNGTAQ